MICGALHPSSAKPTAGRLAKSVGGRPIRPIRFLYTVTKPVAKTSDGKRLAIFCKQESHVYIGKGFQRLHQDRVERNSHFGSGLRLAKRQNTIPDVLAAHPNNVSPALPGVKHHIQSEPGAAARQLLFIILLNFGFSPHPVARKPGAKFADSNGRIIRAHPGLERMAHQNLDGLQPIICNCRAVCQFCDDCLDVFTLQVCNGLCEC